MQKKRFLSKTTMKVDVFEEALIASGKRPECVSDSVALCKRAVTACCQLKGVMEPVCSVTVKGHV